MAHSAIGGSVYRRRRPEALRSSLEITVKAAAVLTAALPSVVVKAANMEPVMFTSTAFAGWGVAAITLRNSANTSSSEKLLTRTPALMMILAASKCWTPLRWIVTISRTTANEPRGYATDLSRATRFTEAWVTGKDAMVRGEDGDRAILCVGFGRPSYRQWGL